ncbi:hypothetical protein VNO80_15494 [Phaseolus coccineus]|uniref:Uncharacterized protein n=1 Tax=Phaseolus coccineus TaxID=3886 RepID=A0AAN9R2D0_PHACN
MLSPKNHRIDLTLYIYFFEVFNGEVSTCLKNEHFCLNPYCYISYHFIAASLYFLWQEQLTVLCCFVSLTVMFQKMTGIRFSLVHES